MKTTMNKLLKIGKIYRDVRKEMLGISSDIETGMTRIHVSEEYIKLVGVDAVGKETGCFRYVFRYTSGPVVLFSLVDKGEDIVPYMRGKGTAQTI